MKHLLRKYEVLTREHEAEAYGFYEAKHTRLFHVASTLHSNAVATSFFIHRRCASFAPQFIERDNKKCPA